MVLALVQWTMLKDLLANMKISIVKPVLSGHPQGML